jgi:hypothetical protein
MPQLSLADRVLFAEYLGLETAAKPMTPTERLELRKSIDSLVTELRWQAFLMQDRIRQATACLTAKADKS